MVRGSEILLLIIFNYFCGIFYQVHSIPIHFTQNKEFQAAVQNEQNNVNRIASLYVITILALSWIAISAIAWGFYYGLKQKLPGNFDQTTNRIYFDDKNPEKDYPVQIDQPVNQTVYPQKKKSCCRGKSRAPQSIQHEPQQKGPSPNTNFVIHSTPQSTWTDSKRLQDNSNPVPDSSKKKNGYDDVTSLSTNYQTNYKPITPDDVYLLKSAPYNSLVPYPAPQNYQVLSSTEIKPEYQYMQSKKEVQNPVLRPVSAYISEPGTPQYIVKGCSQPCMCLYHPNGMVVNLPLSPLPPTNSITTKEQVRPVSRDKRKKQDVCCYASRPKGGSIHPIIQGYRVRGNFRVKRKMNSDIISFMEDSYDVLS